MPKKPRPVLEAVARWLATAAVGVFCAISVVAAPFGCAVGEFEEDRNCSTSALSWASIGLLALTIVAAVATRRRNVQWYGLALTLAAAYAGAAQA